MSSDRPTRSWSRAAIAFFVLPVATEGCVSIDRYASSTGFDAGRTDSSSDITLPDATVERCTTCLESQCGSEWAACGADPDCQSCLLDPLGDGCKQTLLRRPLRNCACVPSTCIKECGTLCFVPAATSQVSGECITCTTQKCAQYISACIADSVCFGCITDAVNPRCPANPAFAATTTCLCTTRNTCFDECTCLPAPDPSVDQGLR